MIGTGGYGYVSTVTTEEYDRQMGDTTAWAANKGYPLMIVSAGKGAMTHLGKRYYENISTTLKILLKIVLIKTVSYKTIK